MKTIIDEQNPEAISDFNKMSRFGIFFCCPSCILTIRFFNIVCWTVTKTKSGQKKREGGNDISFCSGVQRKTYFKFLFLVFDINVCFFAANHKKWISIFRDVQKCPILEEKVSNAHFKCFHRFQPNIPILFFRFYFSDLACL